MSPRPSPTIAAMSLSLPTLFQRLRRHKGGWVLLFAALLIKIAASSVCVLDGPSPGFTGTGTGGGQAQTLPMSQADPGASLGDDDACLLGEGGSCHCACAHAATLPVTVNPLTAMIGVRIIVNHPPTTAIALVERSPLRPPIA